MGLKVAVRYLRRGAGLKFNDNGDCVDVLIPEGVVLKKGEYKAVPLGIAMKLPPGFSAKGVPRSSTFKHHGILVVNSPAVIDNSYSGNEDEWHVLCYATQDCVLSPGDRIFQFEITLNQFATIWQKIKWLFSNGVTFVRHYGRFESEGNRGGIGTSGK